MSLSIQYESLEEAQMRLVGSVVSYDGEPVYIRAVEAVAPGDPKPDIFRVYAKPLPLVNDRGDEDPAQFRKFISSRKFDFSTPRLGWFVGDKGRLYFASRAPLRQQRQGLSQNNLGINDVRGMGGMNFNRALACQGFVDMLKGVVHDFDHSYGLMVRDPELSGVALNYEFALIRDDDLPELIYLYHKMNKVGFIAQGRTVLKNNVQYLRESLLEVGLRIG